MIFTVVSSAIDFLDSLHESYLQDLATKAQDILDAKAREEEVKAASGTPVNKQTFAAWRSKYLVETFGSEDLTEIFENRVQGDDRLTGKEIFLRRKNDKVVDDVVPDDDTLSIQDVRINDDDDDEDENPVAASFQWEDED